ncbi:hypothetical protein BJV77DRAFT_953355 [Russula vinacea]|nr:hypothetical protein BJV77DRAFT_953355 [Russula vinacea]
MASRVSSPNELALYFLAISSHPNALYPDSGIGTDVWINFALWILGWIPGVIHAWYPPLFLWLYSTIDAHMASGGSSPSAKAPSRCNKISTSSLRTY